MSEDLKSIEEQLYLLMKVYDSINQRILETSTLIEIVKELKEGNGLINVSGIFAEGTLTNAKKFIVPVGANYFVEMSKEKVIETLSKQLEKLEEEKNKIKEDIAKLQEKLNKLQTKLE